MPIETTTEQDQAENAAPPIVQLWILRCLLSLGAYKYWTNKHGLINDDIAYAIDLGHLVDCQGDEKLSDIIVVALKKRLSQLESDTPVYAVPDELSSNIDSLLTLVKLNSVERSILEFVILLHGERCLEETLDMLANLSVAKICHAMSILLGHPKSDIQKALSTSGQLFQIGLVRIDRACSGSLRAKVDILGNGFAERMLSSAEDPISVFMEAFSLADPSHMDRAAYPHIETKLRTLVPYLSHSLNTFSKGVNVLIYGAPGTGKTQLARVLAAEIEAKLYEVSSEDVDRDSINGEKRLRSLRTAQAVLAEKRCMIVFDETEDVFADGSGLFGKKSTAQTRKAWMNRMLEENAIPCLWLSNSVEQIDPAFIRRFDMVIELTIPSKSQRIQIIKSVGGDLLNSKTVTQLAESESLSPAVISRAVKVVKSIQSNFEGDDRTVQRDLNELSLVFPLTVDDREKPYGWSWQKDAPSFSLPGLTTPEALTLTLAEQHLNSLLPVSMMNQLKPYFDAAQRRLDAEPQPHRGRSWLDKVRTVPPTQPLIPPKVLPEAQAIITEALLHERQVDIQYRKRGEQKDTAYRIHPLAFVQRGPMLYLYCRLFDYEDPRTLAMNRITVATLLSDAAIYPKGFSLDEKVEAGVWGFGAGGKIIIELLFDAGCGDHLLESPLSKDQVITELEGGRLKICASVANTPQLRWWVMGLGTGVEVLSPSHIRSEIADSVRALFRKYRVK